MNWVLEHQRRPCSPAAEQEGELDPECPPIRATNHSYGPVSGDNESNSFDENSATVRIQRLLVEMGVTPVWAAGNDGGDGSLAKTNPPGMDLTPGVLMVASYNDGGTGNRDNALSGFSSRGQKGQPQTYPDVSAPGDLITSACRPTLAVCTGEPSYDGGNYQTISGTSMATPHVAGVVAQLAEVDPSISPGGTEELIEDTAHKFGTEYEADPQNTDDTTSFDKGHGLVDVLALLAAQQGLAEPAEPEAGPAACTADSPQVVDPADDATQVIAADAGLQSEPNLDVLEGRMSWDAGAQELTFSIEVTDLAAGTSDEFFRFYVSRGTDPEVYAVATRNDSGESFSLRQFDSGASTALTGSFDEETNTVTVVLPAEQYGEVVPDATIAPGDVFAVGQLLGQRATGVVTATADTAQGTCPFTVSSGGTGGGDPDPVVDPGAGGDPGDESAGGDSGSAGAGDSAGGTRGGSGERQDRAAGEQRGAAVSAPTRGRAVVASRSGALPRTGPLMPLTAGLLLLLVGTGVLLAARRGRPAGTD